MNQILLKDIFGGLVIITSLFDAWKYIWQSQAIRKIKTAKGHSRKFLNAAIFNAIAKLLYGIILFDIFIVISSTLAVSTMIYNYFTVYKFYPYRCRGLTGFKRPSIFIYMINSLLPNRLRRRL